MEEHLVIAVNPSRTQNIFFHNHQNIYPTVGVVFNPQKLSLSVRTRPMGLSGRPTGPISLNGVQSSRSGGIATQDSITETERPVVTLTVVPGPENIFGVPASLHPDAAEALGISDGGIHHLCRAGGSDFILPVRVDHAERTGGVIRLDASQMRNLHVAAGDTKDFVVFEPHAHGITQLVEMVVEIRHVLRPGGGGGKSDDEEDDEDDDDDEEEEDEEEEDDNDDDDDDGEEEEGNGGGHQQMTTTTPRAIDASRVVSILMSRCVGRVMCINQLEVIEMGPTVGPLVVRISRLDNLDQGEREDLISYHCFRGMLAPDTSMYVTILSSSGCELVGASPPPNSSCTTGFSRRQLQVRTTDGEGGEGDPYLVSRRLLRPCINLTKAIRDETMSSSTSVDVDTLTFDRVLLFLEAVHHERPPPEFAPHHLDPLLHAAQVLGLRNLEDYVARRRGEMEERVREWTYEEVKEKNDSGEYCLLLIDGMVLDVTRWLPEHPGGSTIIPNQALNVDSTRFFELYHASRESFLYIQSFYVGELATGEWEKVPPPREGKMEHHQPSKEFMEQLAAFTTWRVKPKAAVRVHLGAARG